MQWPPGTTFFRVAGRLMKIAPAAERRGHLARARAGDLSLSSSTTDGSGRFLLEWRGDVPDDGVSIELLDPRAEVSESASLTAADLVSPPVIQFSGDGVVGFGRASEEVDPRGSFEAEGDHPLCVTSSCLEATLTWTSSQGFSGLDILGWRGDGPRGASARWLAERHRGQQPMVHSAHLASRREPRSVSERTVEVRRYPSLSLVLDGDAFRVGSWAEFGAATSCIAGEEGLTVRVTKLRSRDGA